MWRKVTLGQRRGWRLRADPRALVREVMVQRQLLGARLSPGTWIWASRVRDVCCVSCPVCGFATAPDLAGR